MSSLTMKLKNIAGAIRNPATEEKQLPDGHNVTVTNPTADPETGLAKEATLAAASAKLPNAPHLDRMKVSDRLTGYEGLNDQAGDGTVKTFTFSTAPDLVWVRSVGGVSRADPAGGTPTATNGIYCADDEPTPITISGQTTLKVFAPIGAVVSVWGFRYT